jgi:hypothetical protein
MLALYDTISQGRENKATNSKVSRHCGAEPCRAVKKPHEGDIEARAEGGGWGALRGPV